MINLKLVRDNPETLKKSLIKRNFDFDVDNLLKIDSEYRKKNSILEEKNSQRNILSKNIGKYIANKENDLVIKTKKEVEELNLFIDKQSIEVNNLKNKLDELTSSIPNILSNEVPEGKDEEENIEVKKVNKPKNVNFKIKNHWEIGLEKNILDLEKTNVLTGSRFSIYKGKGSKLIRALQALTLDMHTEAGYEEYTLPLILNTKSLFTTGQLPKFKDDLFQLNFKDYFLSPTLEVQLTNLYRDQIIKEEDLPIRITSSSFNFRSEAGSAGKDIKGVLRQHQFIKTELVNISTPNHSYKMLEEMVKQACSILDVLELPYRVVKLCAGDTGFGSSLTYDIEIWMPSYNNYREISSCSNCEDFQARRGMIRYSDSNGKNFAHTLNGTGVSIDRLWIAIIENCQDENGDIIIPKALGKYLNFEKI